MFGFVETRRYDCYQPHFMERVFKLIIFNPMQLLILTLTLISQRNVVNECMNDTDTKAVRDLNRSLRDDKRIEICTLPMGDGLTICTKN